MNAVATVAAPVAHLDPGHPAVVALLAVDVDAGSDAALANTLRPLLEGAPKLREWNCKDEYTTVENAVNAAVRFVMDVDSGKNEAVWYARRHLAADQLRHRIETHITSLAGKLCEGVTLIPGERGIIVESAIGAVITLAPIDVTAREIRIAVDAYENGAVHGRDRVTGGIRRLLDLD